MFISLTAKSIIGQTPVPRPKTITSLFRKVHVADKRLYGWMRLHHDDLLVELGSRRIQWRPVMTVIAELGLRDERDQKPSRDTAFRTWQRVRSDVATARAIKPGNPATVLATDEIAPGVRALLEQENRMTHLRMRLEIRPARALADLPSSAIQPPKISTTPTDVVSVDPAASESATEQIRRVFSAIGGTRTPMPKRIR